MCHLANQGIFRLIRRSLLRGNRQIPVKRSLTKLLLILAAGFIANSALIAPARSETIQNAEDAEALESDRFRTRTVTLKLSEIVQLVMQNNRNLKNDALSRIIARQELEEAESKFSPTITPNFSVSADRSLESDSGFDLIGVDDTTPTVDSDVEELEVEESDDFEFDDFDEDNFDRSLEVGASLLTPLGTDITLTANPLDDFQVLGLEIRQPLMRGAGSKVNRASVKSARLSNTSQAIELRQSLIDEITEAVKAYRALLQAQERVKIQRNSLESRRRDLEAQTALVKAGRRARADLVLQKASVAAAEEELSSVKNDLAQANSDLLKIIDTEEKISIKVPQDSIEAITDEHLLRPNELNREELLQKAYTQRPDYLTANLDIEISQLDLIEQKDALRWQLDAVSNFDLGNDSRVFTALELTRTFGDRSLETALLRSRINFSQKQNDLKDMQETIAIEVADSIRDINSNFANIQKARRAKRLAQERLKIVQELYLRGRDGVDVFEVTSQQDEVVEAQNTELNAVIDYLNAQTDLQQSFGMTLNGLIRLTELEDEIIKR